ncbi:hypothetical protein [Saccharothrix xinjiangensis]|uniref:Uncharacterized protein n=1 Tax=Saccharothrix xinjiangensis TaxID=204798 RepID=A0ABV9XVN2_9PSEU
MMDNHTVVKVLLIALAMLIGVVVGVFSGILSRVSGAHLAVAIRHGGIAFGGTVTLAIVIITALELG